MKNINLVTKRRQNAIFLGVALALGGTALAGMLAYDHFKTLKKSAPVTQPAPDLTGVVDTNFTGKVQTAAIEEAQKLNKMTTQRMNEINNRLDALNRENEDLKKQLISVQQNRDQERNKGTSADSPPAPNLPASAHDVQPGNYRPDSYNVRQPGYQNQPDELRIVDNRSAVLSRKTFDYTKGEDEDAPRFRFPYVPSGSFSPSKIIEGADANASVTGQNDTAPMLLRITGLTQLPNDKTLDLTGCFVSLEVYGDVSSERGEVRTRKISCIIDDETIDQEVKGHVAFRGKNGIKGEVVMRNGEILGWAWGAGFVNGLGGGLQQMGQTQVGMGATATPGFGDVFKSGMGGGASKAANTLSDYYIKRAEQYHPIIPIGAGNEVELVFNDGFQLKTLSELAKEVAQKRDRSDSGDRVGEAVNKTAYQTQAEAKNATELAKYKIGDMLTQEDFKRAASQLPSDN